MNKNLEDLKAIIAGAPSGATHYSNLERVYYAFKCECWMWCPEKSNNFHFLGDDDDVIDDLRSLSDIEQIIELVEWQIEANKNYQSMIEDHVEGYVEAYLNE